MEDERYQVPGADHGTDGAGGLVAEVGASLQNLGLGLVSQDFGFCSIRIVRHFNQRNEP